MVEVVSETIQFPEAVATLITNFNDVFSSVLPVAPAKVPPMHLQLEDAGQLPLIPPRRQSPVITEFIKSTVQELLALGHIIPSTSPVASPVVVVRSPGKDWRMCIDYREVNSKTVSLLHPLPNLKGILSRVGGHKYYAKLDLRKGYNQAAMDPASRYLTAFITEAGQFEYTRVPFGLKNAPAYFQKVISTVVLAGLVGVICEVYIDDVITFGDNEAELFDNLSVILSRFREFGLVVHPTKCVLGVKEVEFLGHKLSSLGLQLSENKKQGLLALQPPVDTVTLKSFLGLANYFRDFISNFASRCANLHHLASPKVSFSWSEIHAKEFEDIRRAVIDAPMLFHIDYSLPLILRTDASKSGVGAQLLNINDGIEQPICFVSQKFLLQLHVGLQLIRKHMLCIMVLFHLVITFVVIHLSSKLIIRILSISQKLKMVE